MNYRVNSTAVSEHFFVQTYVFQFKICGELQRLSFKLEATGRVSVSLPRLHYLANDCAFVMSEQYRGCWHLLLDYHENTVSCSRGKDLSHVRIKKITKQSLCYEYSDKAAEQRTQEQNPLWGIFHSHGYAAWICITSLMVMLALRHRQPSPAQ